MRSLPAHQMRLPQATSSTDKIITRNFCVASFMYLFDTRQIICKYNLTVGSVLPRSQQCLNCRYLTLLGIKLLVRFGCTSLFRSTHLDDKKSLLWSLPTAMINIPAIPIHFCHSRMLLFTCWLHQNPPFPRSR